MTHLPTLLLMTTLALAASPAEAAFVVDTGPGEASGLGVPTLSANQFFGASFNLSSAMTITSAEGWIGGDSGDIRMELHAGNTPTGALLFSALVTIDDPANDWRGATGVNWNVAAGDYTLTVSGQGNYSGHMVPRPANPVASDWFFLSLNGGWLETELHQGWRIGADPAPVPLPAGQVLMLLGLSGLAAVARRRR